MYNLSDVISKSLKLAWKHKMLWILALMLGSMGSFNSGGGSNSNSVQENQQQYQEQNPNYNEYNQYDKRLNSTPTNLVGMVLGESASRPNIDEYISMAVKEVGVSNIVLLSVGLLVFITFSILVSVFTQSWATGAFLGGIDDAIGERTYTLKDLGNYGRRSLKELLRYKLLFIIAGVIIVVISIAAGLAALLADAFTLLGVAMLLLIPVFILLLVLSLGNNFALRFIALKSMSAFDAIKAGLKMFLNNVGKVIILSVTNCLVVSALMLVTLGILVGFLMSFILPGSFIDFESANSVLLGSLVVILIPLLFALIGLFMAVGAYLTTYKNFTWSMFFNFANTNDKYKIVDTPVVTSIQGGQSNGTN